LLNLSSQKQTFLFGSIPQTAFILPFFLSRIFVPLFFYIVDIQLQNSSHMNSVVRQLWEQNTDVVMVDTGNSYEGLCEYVGGKYISYTEEKPITMNPFRINREELNVEKTGFLKNLVLLIWKGSQGTVTKTEDRLIDQVITEYYDTYFNVHRLYTSPA